MRPTRPARAPKCLDVVNLARFCQRQNSYWREIDRFAVDYGPMMRLRFEDLVTDTEVCMRRVCEFSEIDFSSAVLEYTQGGEASRSNSSFAASSGIDRGVLTRYRDTLPAQTVAYLEQHCLPELFWRGPDQSGVAAGDSLTASA